MRFNEFKTILEKKIIDQEGSTGYYTVGDSHAEGLASYSGKPWNNKAKRGTRSTDPMHMAAIDSIPKGSVVLISLGANDAASGKPDPNTIASSVSRIVNAATGKGLKVTFLLFPVGTKPNSEIRSKTREAIRQSLNVPIIDLEGSTLVDGVHANASAYIKASKQVLSGTKPTVSLGTPDASPGAPTTKEKITSSENLEQGPPFPQEQKDEVKRMQTGLQELGYSLGRLGVDGKYGPATAAAVEAFKKDYEIGGSGSSFGKNEFDMLDKIQSGQVKKKTPTQATGNVIKRDLPPLADDARTKGKIGQVLDLIAGPESRGHYDIMFGSRRHPEILDMTITELFKFQRDYKRGNITGKPMETAASGRYQFMPNTLAECVVGLGMNPNKEKFSPENQDKLIIYRLRSIRRLDDWLSGKISNEQFMDNLAMEFASFPAPSKGGRSWYDKVGSNKAGISVAAVDQKLSQIQQA
jgi:peptidoglycan hydrolase-like protein with peptidoglycan-binding domain